MNLPPAGFDDLVGSVLDGTADDSQLANFRLVMRQQPDLLDDYIAQCDIHAALTTIAGGANIPAGQQDPSCYAVPTAPPISAVTARSSRALNSGATATAWQAFRFRKVAAAVAALLGLMATGLWLAADDGPAADAVTPVAGRESPVKILHHGGSRNLEVPERLPGTLRMTNGRITARLSSGIELVLLGPIELEIRNPMEARLRYGRLLAEASETSGGFMLHTPDFEMWDNGALYSVTVTDAGSDVFVFEGEVQVVEADGEPVDICRTGEGARARRDGSGAVKIAADWPEAAQLMASTSLKAITSDPDKALKNAVVISDGWAERYLPEEAWRKSQRMAAMYAASQKIPFSKKAWARPQARAKSTMANSGLPVKEESVMTTKSAVGALLAAATLTGAGSAGAFSAPAQLFFAPHLNRHWSAVYTNEVPLNWEWPAGAITAELSITGMHSSFTTNFTTGTSGYLWRAFESAEPTIEDVYSLTLVFKDNAETMLATQTASLAVLKGSFGGTTMDPGPDDRKWSKVTDNVVIPYDAEWTSATFGAATGQLVIAKVGGNTQTNTLADAAGYFGWKLKKSGWGHGTFNLALTFPEMLAEEGWSATLLYLPGGTIVSLR